MGNKTGQSDAMRSMGLAIGVSGEKAIRTPPIYHHEIEGVHLSRFQFGFLIEHKTCRYRKTWTQQLTFNRTDRLYVFFLLRQKILIRLISFIVIVKIQIRIDPRSLIDSTFCFYFNRTREAAQANTVPCFLINKQTEWKQMGMSLIQRNIQ